MKKILLIILAGLLITVAILFVHPSKSLDQNLVLAEELMSDRPDSALKILEKLKLENFSGENKALYALLMTQAQFKNYNFPESDSLIKIAYDYYISGNDSLRKAQTYLYSGRVDEIMGKMDNALKNFQKASTAVFPIQNYKLLSLIYNRWGLFLRKQNIFNDALLIQNKSFKYASLANDSNLQVFILTEIGVVYSAKQEYDEAEVYFKRALYLAKMIDNKNCISDIYSSLSYISKCDKKYDEGLFYVNESISLLSDSAKLYSRYSLKGDLLSLKHQYDSARYYLSLSKGNNNLALEATYYLLMSKLEEGLGNYKVALLYSNKHIDYIFDYVDKEKDNTIAELQKKYDYSIVKNDNIQLELDKKNRNVIILIVLIVSILIIWYITYRYNKIRHEKDEIIKAGKEQLQQMADALIEWEMKLKEVKLKSKADLDAFINWVFSKNEAIRKIERLSNMGISERIANKEEMMLTPSEILNLKDVVDICFNYFATRLSKEFPSLTEDSILHCCLLRMKVPASSIAILVGVSDSTLVKRKYRLKKEINEIIKGCLSLEDFLLNF